MSHGVYYMWFENSSIIFLIEQNHLLRKDKIIHQFYKNIIFFLVVLWVMQT